jgi:hypothetical protein
MNYSRLAAISCLLGLLILQPVRVKAQTSTTTTTENSGTDRTIPVFPVLIPCPAFPSNAVSVPSITAFPRAVKPPTEPDQL